MWRSLFDVFFVHTRETHDLTLPFFKISIHRLVKQRWNFQSPICVASNGHLVTTCARRSNCIGSSSMTPTVTRRWEFDERMKDVVVFFKNDVSLSVWKGGDRFFYEMWATLFGTFRSWLVTRNFACEKDASLLHMSGITSKNRYRDIRYRAMTYTSTHMAPLHMPWRYSWFDKLLWNNHRKARNLEQRVQKQKDTVA